MLCGARWKKCFRNLGDLLADEMVLVLCLNQHRSPHGARPRYLYEPTNFTDVWAMAWRNRRGL